MDSNNIFTGGMNSDMSKIFQSNEQYLKATNLRPVGVVGGSTGSLVNIRGTECQMTFPDLKAIYKLSIYKVYDLDGIFIPGTIKLTINGQVTDPITILEITNVKEIASYIKKLINCYTGVNTNSTTFGIAYNTNFIYIYQNPEYSTCASETSIEPIITIEQLIEGSTIGFNYADGTLNDTVYPYILGVENDNLVIIGSTYIGETIYLFTCPSTNSSSLGQIWEVMYNDITKVTTVKLIYNNIINFSKEFPIPPSAAIGRFELGNLQRIYWSDNNNSVRSMNVKDENSMAIDTNLLNLTPSINMSVPTLDVIIDSGAIYSLRTDTTYQCAYRLIKNNSSITNYSVVSNIVVPVHQPTSNFVGGSDWYASLDGTVDFTGKSIRWRIDGIDTDYDIIEFVIITRKFPSNDVYDINKYETALINGQTSMTTTFKNDIDAFETITSDEFLIENTAFTHCKTLEQKDNRLFFGNVANDISNVIDTFDTRAFRFNVNTSNIIVKKLDTDQQVTTKTIWSNNDYASLSETDDCIPVYNLGMDSSDDARFNNNVKYQLNSTIIGGTGPNISYKFGNILLLSDETPLVPSSTSVFGSYEEGTTRDDISATTWPYRHGYRKAGTVSNLSILSPYYSNLAPNQIYNTNLAKCTMGLEYFNGTYRSYEQNEIYRFGIKFYAKNGTGSFVKWIADIKFPNYNDPIPVELQCQADNQSFCTDFRSMYYAGNKAYCNVPYIQFDVNIPEGLDKLISGFEIVRVERKDEDMSITGHGIINQLTNGGNVPFSYVMSNDKNSYATPPEGIGSLYATVKGFSYHPFKQLVDGDTGSLAKDDKIIVSEKYQAVLDAATWPLSTDPSHDGITTFENHWFIRKFYNLAGFIYNQLTEPYSIFKINDVIYITPGDQKAILGFPFTTFINVDSVSHSQGSACLIVSLQNDLTWSYYYGVTVGVGGGDNGTCKLLAFHFKPSRLISQYGGRSYIARTQNEYISCGAFYNVNSGGSKKINVLGGDIFHGILDIQKETKTILQTHSQTWFFPTHSKYNVDLRSGIRVNADLNDITAANALYNEEYIYNQAYSFENTLHKHFPKPIDFNQTSTFYNRIYWSNVKTNGETADSWTSIPILNFHDVDGNYGGITAFITLKTYMYFIQESAMGILLINQQSLMTDQNSQTLNVGVGQTLNKHLYHSVDIGSKHQWSIYKSNDAITFCDIRRNKLFMFDGQAITPVSDIKGARGFLNKVLHDSIITNDNPIIGKGILTTYDFKNNEFLYTFLNQFSKAGETFNSITTTKEKYTLVFSDLTGEYSAFYDATPYIYINNHNKLFSSNSYEEVSNTKLYLHNVGNYGVFYDVLYPSTLKVNINPNGIVTKVFDNLSWISESIKDEYVYLDDINNNVKVKSSIADLVTYNDSDNINYLKDTFDRIRCYNEYQNTDWILLDQTPITGNLRKVEQGFNVQVLRNKVNYDNNPINTKSIFDPSILTKTEFGERMRDKYIIVDLSYPNGTNNRFIIHNLKSTYRVSDR